MNNNHSTKAETLTAGDFFLRTYFVPLYQREYAWGRDQIWQLLDDLLDAYESGKITHYHIGSLTVFLRADVTGNRSYELIDGQQRTITLALLLRLLAESVPSIISSFRLSERLRFENRPDAEAFLAAFDEHPDNPPFLPMAFRRAVDVMCDHPIFGEEKKAKLSEFAEFVRSQVMLFLVTMPSETDVSAYFEIMNNRGIQLEFHELLKAKLIAKLPDYTDKVLFDRLWTACSNMDIRLADHLDENTIAALEIHMSWVKHRNESVKIINVPTDSSTSRSILPDFPNFLLHVLRFYLKTIMSKEETVSVPLDERQMRKVFDNQLDTIVSERFLDALIRIRLRFDRFVIKAVGGDNGSDISWKIVGKDCWSQQDKERLIHLQSMLQVSYPSRRHKEWLSLLLCEDDLEDAPRLITLLESFVRKWLQAYGSINSLKCLGTATPHLVLNLIDYLMYCTNPEKYSNNASFRFAYRNSVEHHFPQGSENDTWTNEAVNDIGNLYLLAKSDNSALNVRSPKEKVALAGNLDNLPPKRREMYQLTLDSNLGDWTPTVMWDHHSKKVLGLIEAFLNEPINSNV